ncbi:phage tail assembly protein [Acinetobacter sp. WCHAc060033]|uniref:phage tail assembly protein n=1 Tax=Acinetobacter sp. WCHAc060033 TaxID=2518624 RepID=UPI001023E70B|nr:phage tail assembly protein [Acinetobacter sp. WCHAc060033]RZG78573.1 phage tail assembly protein [Acinetobacter sp. WCHAc060033]
MTIKPEYIDIDESAGKHHITLSRGYDCEGILTMREPTVQDLLSAELQTKGKTDAEQEITMFSNLCEVSPDSIKKLGLKDYKRVQESYRLFTE